MITLKDKNRFWSKVIKTDNCWIWQGSVSRGYGQFCLGKRMIKAHHFLILGSIPDGMIACHSCDNRRYVRPSHIIVGTHLFNAKDRGTKGRGAKPKGELHGGHKLTDDIVRLIKRCSLNRGALTELCNQIGIDVRYASKIRRNTLWQHIT